MVWDWQPTEHTWEILTQKLFSKTFSLFFFFFLENMELQGSVSLFVQRSDSDLFADLCFTQLWAFSVLSLPERLCSAQLPALQREAARGGLEPALVLQPQPHSHRCCAYPCPSDLGGSFQILSKSVHSYGLDVQNELLMERFFTFW